MSKIKILPLILITFLSSVISAQENAVKLGLSDALLGNFNLSYEHAMNEKSAIQLKFGYWQPTLSPFISDDAITPEAFELQKAQGGINMSLEYRFYTSKGEALKGLYLTPFLRYINQSAMFTDEIDGNLFDVDARLNSIGIGGQIGYQFIVNDIITIDLYFFGAGIDRHALKFKYVLQTPQTGFDYNSITDDVSEVFEDINYLEKKLKHEVSEDNLTSKLPFLFPGFRIGVNVGIAF